MNFSWITSNKEHTPQKQDRRILTVFCIHFSACVLNLFHLLSPKWREVFLDFNLQYEIFFMKKFIPKILFINYL